MNYSGVHVLFLAHFLAVASSVRRTIAGRDVDLSREDTMHGKEITYIRHGKSAGNAGVFGLIEKGSLDFYKDGELVAEGETQAVDRVAAMSREERLRIANTEVVLVSPLKRAMATAVILLLQAHSHFFSTAQVAAEGHWPKVEVVTELREKVESDSERPGLGSSPKAYVLSIAQKYSESLYGSSSILDAWVDQMFESYEAEKQRTTDPYGNPWHPEPTNGLSYMTQINVFKAKLDSRTETKLLLVAHSGWARYAFSAFLPAVGEETDEVKLSNLINGARKVHPLNNAGVIKATFSEGSFNAVVADFHSPGTDEFPNCDEEEKVGILMAADAITAGVVPADAQFAKLLCKKKSAWVQSWNTRLLTFSASGGVAHLSWGDHWGKPQKSSIVISGGLTTISRNAGDIFHIVNAAHGDFSIQMFTEEDATQFVQYFNDFKAKR